MNKQTMLDFYRVFGHDTAKDAEPVITDLMAAWSKFDKQVAKNPSLVRKAIQFGIALGEEMRTGRIKPRQKSVKTDAAPGVKTVSMQTKAATF